MLTGQAGRHSVPMPPTLKECAQSHYGPRNFIHIVPPTTTDRGDYFSDLERQCGADAPVGSDVGFMQAVESYLTGNNPVLLFVTGFERSSEKRRNVSMKMRHAERKIALQLHRFWVC